MNKYKKLLAYLLTACLVLLPFQTTLAFDQMAGATQNVVYRGTATGLRVSAVDGTAFIDNAVLNVLPQNGKVVASGSSTQANTRIATVATGALLELVGVDLSAHLGKYIKVMANGKTLGGYIGAAGGESLDADLLAGWDFTSGWTVIQSTIINSTSFNGTGTPTGLYKTADIGTVLGALYKSSFDGTTSAGTLGVGGEGYISPWILDGQTDKYVTRTGSPSYSVGPKPFIQVLNATANVTVATLTIQRVLDLATTGAKIYSTSALATQSWAVNDGIDPNYSSGYTYEIIDVSLTAFTDGSHEIQIYDSTGKVAKGALKAVGTSEVLDATNLVTEWTNVNYDTFTSVASPDIAAAVYTTSGTQTATSNSMVTTAGKLYKLVATWTNVAGQAPTLTGTNGFPTTTLSAGANNIYFVATGSSVVITTTNTAAASWGCTFVLKQVTAPGTAGSTIVSTKGGATQNFSYKDASFIYNEASYVVVVKKIKGGVVVASGSITAGNTLMDLTTANAFAAPVGVDLTAYQTGNYLMRWYFSSGILAAEAWISATAPSGLVEPDLLAGWDFTSGWLTDLATVVDQNTFIATGDYGSVRPPLLTLVRGGLYKTTFGASGGNPYIYFSGSTTEFYSGETDKYRTMVGSPTSLRTATSIAATVDVSVLSFARTTMPAATGGLLLSSKGGSRGFAYKHASLTGNEALSWQVILP